MVDGINDATVFDIGDLGDRRGGSDLDLDFLLG